MDPKYESMCEGFGAVEPERTVICIVTLAELRYGAAWSARPGANHRHQAAFFGPAYCVELFLGRSLQ